MNKLGGTLVHIGSQNKTRQSQNYKSKELAQTSIFLILKKKTLYMRHTFWCCLIKMYKYEMDPDMILSTDGQTDKVKPE